MIIDGWRNIIDVWRSEIIIPEKLAQRIAAELSVPTFGKWKLRDEAGADVCSVLGVDCVFADGICDWHDDLHLDHQYSLLLVLRNDIGSYVQCDSLNVVKDQPPGTMIFLDIHKQHRLWHDLGKDAPLCCWYAACIDLEKPPHDHEACEALMRKKLERVKNG